MQIHNQRFKVVGVFASEGRRPGRPGYGALHRAAEGAGDHFATEVTVSAGQAGDATRIADDIKTLLRKRHPAPTTGRATGAQVGALAGIRALPPTGRRTTSR